MRRLILLISVGWLPPYLCPLGAFLSSRGEGLGILITMPRVTPNRGRASYRVPVKNMIQISSYAASFTSFAMAHMNEASSLAMAVTATFGFLPRAVSLRYLFESRT